MKTINSNGTCSNCLTKSIHYSILNGSYTYECLKCDKMITKFEILTDAQFKKVVNHEKNNVY